MQRQRKVANPKMTDISRRLRRNMPVPERLLWARLRGEQLRVKFRRQYAIEPYVADFYCHAAKLVVELDGVSHEGRSEEDRVRQAFFEGLGLRVVRFSDDDVLKHLDAVVEGVWREVGARLSEAPSPDPSRREGS